METGRQHAAATTASAATAAAAAVAVRCQRTVVSGGGDSRVSTLVFGVTAVVIG